MTFPILTHDQLCSLIRTFDAISYGKTRNYLTGGVSKLSPYITHGVITTKDVVSLSLKQYRIDQAESWYKELLWREYFVHIHYHRGDQIFNDMEEDKTGISKLDLLPEAIQTKTFSSSWINDAIKQLENTGYLHNHMRMRLASALVHWHKLYRKKCADRTYYHFLDGELGSNHLSWQRVASTFAHKPYFMNEDNLKKFGTHITDPIFRGEYDEVAARLFDEKRQSEIQGQADIHHTLTTDLSAIAPIETVADGTTILTPWDLHPSKIPNPETTICVLDPAFFSRHPRSKQRIAFVKGYCDLYGVLLLQGSVSDLLAQAKNCILYETRNPRYREAYETAKKHGHTIIAHDRCSPIAATQYTKKFFPFWAKSIKHLYEMEKAIAR